MPPEAVVFGKSLLVVSPVNLIFFTFYHLFLLRLFNENHPRIQWHVLVRLYLCCRACVWLC